MNETANTSAIFREQMIINFYNHPIMGKSWNDMLLERGSWPLFIIFYGLLFLAFWLIIYYSFKFSGYEDDEEPEEKPEEKV